MNVGDKVLVPRTGGGTSEGGSNRSIYRACPGPVPDRGHVPRPAGTGGC